MAAVTLLPSLKRHFNRRISLGEKCFEKIGDTSTADAMYGSSCDDRGVTAGAFLAGRCLFEESGLPGESRCRRPRRSSLPAQLPLFGGGVSARKIVEKAIRSRGRRAAKFGIADGLGLSQDWGHPGAKLAGAPTPIPQAEIVVPVDGMLECSPNANNQPNFFQHFADLFLGAVCCTAG